MTRQETENYISQTYGAEPEYPWTSYPAYAVFRHTGSRKWFAVVMRVSKERLGLPEEEAIDILNVKCEPVLIGSLLAEPGFFPAYHMNKNNWITIALDGTVDAGKIERLLDMSYDFTAPRRSFRK